MNSASWETSSSSARADPLPLPLRFREPPSVGGKEARGRSNIQRRAHLSGEYIRSRRACTATANPPDGKFGGSVTCCGSGRSDAAAEALRVDRLHKETLYTAQRHRATSPVRANIEKGMHSLSSSSAVERNISSSSSSSRRRISTWHQGNRVALCMVLQQHFCTPRQDANEARRCHTCAARCTFTSVDSKL